MFRKYGQKKSWHLVGLVCVLISFPFIFLPCIGCSGSDEWAQLIYYSAFAIIFQFGWASMQVRLVNYVLKNILSRSKSSQSPVLQSVLNQTNLMSKVSNFKN